MKKLQVSMFVLVLAAFAGSAQAQATRTWVSGVGDDVNPCSRTAPCKTYAGAISKTAAGGIISTLDPGGFGAVTITKGMFIDGSDQIAGVLNAGTNGIVINAGVNDTVVLRNLEIHGAGTGFDGIRILQAKHVIIDNCIIQRQSSNGIEILNSTNTINVHIRNSRIANVTGQGVFIAPTGTGVARVTIQDSVVTNSASNGVDVAGANSSVSIMSSTIQSNANGVVVQPTNGTAFLESSLIAYNGTGVFSGVGGATPVIRMSGCMVVGNTTNGIAAGGIGGGSGTVVGFQSNTVVGNTGNNNVSSSVAQQ